MTKEPDTDTVTDTDTVLKVHVAFYIFKSVSCASVHIRDFERTGVSDYDQMLDQTSYMQSNVHVHIHSNTGACFSAE